MFYEDDKKREYKPFNKTLLYILILLMTITGSTNTIFNKIIQNTEGKDILFQQHHWLIAFTMFIGELISIFYYIFIVIKRKEDKSDDDGEKDNEEIEEGKIPVPTNFIFSISALCDLLSSTLNTFGLTYLTSSMFQMLRGFQLFFICLLSKMILKNEIYSHQYLGVGIVILGLFIVGVKAITYDKYQIGANPVAGIILIILAQFFGSIEYIIQEKFIKKYIIHPSQLVGFEGLWGSCMYIILLIIFQNISCKDWAEELRNGICFSREENNKTISYIEDTLFALKQMGDNLILLILYIFYVISIALYNLVGIKLTELVSSTARVVVDEVRTVFIWLFFIFFNKVNGTEEKFHYLQLIGYIFLLLGTLIYNEILVIPFCNLDYNTRDKREEREINEQNEKDKKEQLYISTRNSNSEL
mgnify:CR=1 FL=1